MIPNYFFFLSLFPFSVKVCKFPRKLYKRRFNLPLQVFPGSSTESVKLWRFSPVARVPVYPVYLCKRSKQFLSSCILYLYKVVDLPSYFPAYNSLKDSYTVVPVNHQSSWFKRRYIFTFPFTYLYINTPFNQPGKPLLLKPKSS